MWISNSLRVLAILGLVCVASADGIDPGGIGQNIGGGFNFDSGIGTSGAGGGGGCSNSFDFSKACNSQYLGGI